MKQRTIQFCTILFISSLIISFPSKADSERGLASYYADSLNGNKTASGEPYNKNDLTAAHRTLEFGTSVKVTYLKTGKIVEVRINDRGPHVKDRIIDLSGAAAKEIGLKEDGIGEVSIEFSSRK